MSWRFEERGWEKCRGDFSDFSLWNVQASCLRLRQRDVIKRILVNIQRGSKRLVRSRHNVASSSARSKTANGDAIHGRFKLKSRKQYCPTLYRLLLRKQSFCTQVTPHQIRPTETENDRAKSSSSALRERQRSSDSGRRAAGGEGPNKRTNGQVIKREREREREERREGDKLAACAIADVAVSRGAGGTLMRKRAKENRACGDKIFEPSSPPSRKTLHCIGRRENGRQATWGGIQWPRK